MPKAIDVEAEYIGIISRPLITLSITISPTLKTLPTENITPHYHIQIPDTSRLINVPVKRSFGIKKTYVLSFFNGKVIENTIKKSSEFESIITIPIKIAKALVSIPAELFSFKINNIKRQTSLETEKQNLSSALLTSRKNEIGLEADLLKAKLESQKTLLTYEAELTKIKIDADKSLLDSQKNIAVANKELVVAKKEWENAKKELEDLLAKIEAAKKPGS